MPVAHVEAGLRSFDRTMPEEINRLLTDQIAELLYTTERIAAENLAREGVPAERIAFVGNVMIDSLRANLPRAVAPQETLRRAGLSGLTRGRRKRGVGRFGLVTLHRPSNVDHPDALGETLAILRNVAERLPLVCPLHPRTQVNIERFGLRSLLATERIAVLPPQGYLETLGLMANADASCSPTPAASRKKRPRSASHV